MTRGIDARLWLLWSLTTLTAASATHNPLYVIVLLLTTAVVGAYGTPERDWHVPLRFALVAVPLGSLFTGLTGHQGATVLLRLPERLPLLGGPLTLESLLLGATNGLTLTTIFTGFLVFNRAASTRDLVNLVPRAFHEAGVVISIALTFIPQTRRSLTRIREAQAVRGHRVRTARDWLPILVPLLVNGLEQSLGLAEAMVARGYGAVADRRTALRTQAALVAGLTLLLGGWLGWLLSPPWRMAAAGLAVAGGAVILGAGWGAGRGHRRTTYRPRRWGWRDTAVLLGCGLTLAVLLLPLGGRGTLAYSFYPRLTPPPFDPLIGAGLLGMAAPAVSYLLSAPPRTAD